MKKKKNVTTDSPKIDSATPLKTTPAAPISVEPTALPLVTPILTLDDNVIAHRAYSIWQAEGEPVGRDLEHWLKAEAEVRTGAATATGPAVDATNTRP